MATLIPHNGDPRYIEPASGRAFTLAELQAIVGGYIEVLRTPFELQDDRRPLIMFLNEDGKRLQLPINRFATHIMRSTLRPDDYIVGDVVICTPLEAEDNMRGDFDEDEYHGCEPDKPTPCQRGSHRFEGSDRWGVILGVSKCTVCGCIATKSRLVAKK